MCGKWWEARGDGQDVSDARHPDLGGDGCLPIFSINLSAKQCPHGSAGFSATCCMYARGFNSSKVHFLFFIIYNIRTLQILFTVS